MKREPAAFAQRGIDQYRAAVGFDNLLGNIESESESVSVLAADLRKTLEYSAYLVGWNAGAVVLD
jgi:hypothetical protein